jgi:hypothetical protein
MIKIQSQAEEEFLERFYSCSIAEHPEPKEFKLWLTLIGDEEPIKEADLIDRVLILLNKNDSPENNTRALNMIFDARNAGYIKDIGKPWKHMYKLNRSFIIEGE